MFPFLLVLGCILTNGRRRVKLMETVGRLFFDGNALARLMSRRPDLVISDALNFGQLSIVREILGKNDPSTRYVVYVTDPVTLHWGWRSDAADWYFVGTEVAAEQCVEAFGADPESVRVVGLPVRSAFRERRNKREVRRELGLDPDLFTAVFMGGTSGAGNIERYIAALDAADLPIQRVVVAGRNSWLQEHLRQHADQHRLHVHGFVNNVHELMQAADLVVTKAGPGTIAEGIASGVPICISGHFPWTEQGNTDYYVKLGKAIHVSSPDELVARLERILAGDDEVYARMDTRMSDAPPEASAPIGRAFVSILHRRGPAELAGVGVASSMLQPVSNAPR
jgi:1,2-diacylglycerol 3-beta-galactosyltransferase